MTTTEQLTIAADALRAANHATTDPTTLDHSDLYTAGRVIAALPRLLEQLAANAMHLAASGLDVDEMTDQSAGVLAAKAAEDLRAAALAMAGVTVSPAALVNDAHSRLSHLKIP